MYAKIVDNIVKFPPKYSIQQQIVDVSDSSSEGFHRQSVQVTYFNLQNNLQWLLANGYQDLSDSTIYKYTPRPSLQQLKDKAIYDLWYNYKQYQRTYVDPQDLQLAAQCTALGSQKGKAVQMWVMGLWRQYYYVRDTIVAAQTQQQLNSIDLRPESFGTPAYTIRQLNDEAAVYLANQ